MTTRFQILRSSTTGNIPASGARQPGELWINFADFALGFIDASKNAQRITAVRYFQTTANYAVGDFVIQGGSLYVANTAITAGAFTAGQWNKITTTSDIPAAYVLPTASTSVLGGVKIDGSSINIAAGVISATPYSLPIASTTVLGGVKVDGTTITATGAGVISTAGGQPANPNRLDNGDMSVDQHNAGASVVVPATNGIFITDRWQVTSSKANKLTSGQNYSVAGKASGFQYFTGVQTAAAVASPVATDYFQLIQYLEGDAVSDLMFGAVGAQSITLSFWVNSSLTGTFGGAVQNYAGSRSYVFTYSISTANTWTKITITIPGDTVGTWVMSGNAASLKTLYLILVPVQIIEPRPPIHGLPAAPQLQLRRLTSSRPSTPSGRSPASSWSWAASPRPIRWIT